jgi:hypothetical protein
MENKPRPLPQDKRSLFIYFYYEYKPVKFTHQANMFMSTKSVYELMRNLYSGKDFNFYDVEAFLKKAGYKIESMGNSNTDLRWLIKT